MRGVERKAVVAARPGSDDRVHSAAKLAAVVELLVERGVAAEDLLRKTGLTASELRQRQTRVSLTQILTCYANADRLSGEAHFGYTVGTHTHATLYGAFGFAILSGTNFRETMEFATRYHQLAAPLTEIEFSESGGLGIWTVRSVSHPLVDAALERFLVEMQFGLHTSLIRDVMGADFTPLELQVTWPTPADAETYPAAIGCCVLCGQKANRFIFDAARLDALPQLGNALTYASVVELCDAQLREIGLGVGFAGQVRNALLTNLLRPQNFEEVAQQIGQSPRTLRRRLREEGTSFRRLVDQLHMDLAIRHLRDGDRTVEEIAFALGFSDAANFRHAFRRWTEVAPSQFKTNARRLLVE